MLFPLRFGYLFYDTCVVIIICESCIKYDRNNSDADFATSWWMLKFVFCRRILYIFFITLIYAAPLFVCIKYLESTWFTCSVSPSYFCNKCCIDHLLCMMGVFRPSGTTDYCNFCHHWRQNLAIWTDVEYKLEICTKHIKIIFPLNNHKHIGLWPDGQTSKLLRCIYAKAF